MNYRKFNFTKKVGLIGAFFGSLALFMPLVARAQYQNYPNAEPNTQERMLGEDTVVPTTPPLPSTRSMPIAYVPVQGAVNIRLINNTGDPITFEVIGLTDQRILSGESMTMLDSLNAPLTLTFQRPNGGLIDATTSTINSNVLEVRLGNTNSLEVDDNTLRIDDDGRVYAY